VSRNRSHRLARPKCVSESDPPIGETRVRLGIGGGAQATDWRDPSASRNRAHRLARPKCVSESDPPIGETQVRLGIGGGRRPTDWRDPSASRNRSHHCTQAHYLLHYSLYVVLLNMPQPLGSCTVLVFAYSVVVMAGVEEETGVLTMILDAEGAPVLIIDAMEGSPL